MKAALIICGAMWLALGLDMTVFGHGFPLLTYPIAFAVLGSAGLLWGFVRQSDDAVPVFAVAPVSFEYGGSRWVLVVGAVAVLLSPRLGMPLLGFAMARFRGASLISAIIIGLVCAAMMELLLIGFLGVFIPLLPFSGGLF